MGTKQVDSLDPGQPELLTPLLVDGTGRGGTTLMMQLLGTSPQIAFDRVYPYEFRYFGYFIRWSRVIDGTEWRRRLWGSSSLRRPQAEHGLIGPPPWDDRSLIGSPAGRPSLADSALELAWAEFSRRAIANAPRDPGQPDVPVLYFAEKQKHSSVAGLPDGVPSPRPVALVRDPRDVWLSWIAFNQKRQRGFGPLRHQPEDRVIGTFISDQRGRLQRLARALEAGEPPVFRYEDLIEDIGSAAARLSRLLAVRLDPEAVTRQRAAHQKHMTSVNPEASVGRWRSEMDRGLAATFAEELGDELAGFGYEP